MKKAILFLLLPLFIASCNDDPTDNGGSGSSKSNENGNASLITAHSVKAVSEKKMDTLAIAGRMEMPRLNGGSTNLFIVHQADNRVNYAMEYDCSKKASRWTAFRWDKEYNSSNGTWNRNNWYTESFNGYGGGDPFQPDPLIPSAYQTALADYRSSGYNRGHMLASADRLNSKESNGQTFYLSNMHPQLYEFNANDGKSNWYTLEIRIRKMYDIDSFRDTLYVVKGGTIAEGQYSMVKGSGNSLVCPKYFYMAILCKNSQKSQGGYKAIAFWMEHKGNSDSNVENYAISIDALEQKTGIDFFCNLPDDIEATVEKNLVLSAWGFK